MDFTTRQPASPSTDRFEPAGIQNKPQQTENKSQPKPKKESFKHKQAWVQGVMIFFLLCLVVLVVALLLSLASDNPHEAKYVNTSGLQSVTVAGAGNQPEYYFGNIAAINDNYLVLDNAYTTTASNVGTNPVNVTPLSCTPINNTTQLVLSRARVISWDNLASDSDAVKAIQSFKSSYSNSQCPETQSTAQPVTVRGPNQPANTQTTTNSNPSASSSNPAATTSPTNSTTSKSTTTTPEPTSGSKTP